MRFLLFSFIALFSVNTLASNSSNSLHKSATDEAFERMIIVEMADADQLNACTFTEQDSGDSSVAAFDDSPKPRVPGTLEDDEDHEGSLSGSESGDHRKEIAEFANVPICEAMLKILIHVNLIKGDRYKSSPGKYTKVILQLASFLWLPESPFRDRLANVASENLSFATHLRRSIKTSKDLEEFARELDKFSQNPKSLIQKNLPTHFTINGEISETAFNQGYLVRIIPVVIEVYNHILCWIIRRGILDSARPELAEIIEAWRSLRSYRQQTSRLPAKLRTTSATTEDMRRCTVLVNEIDEFYKTHSGSNAFPLNEAEHAYLKKMYDKLALERVYYQNYIVDQAKAKALGTKKEKKVETPSQAQATRAPSELTDGGHDSKVDWGNGFGWFERLDNDLDAYIGAADESDSE